MLHDREKIKGTYSKTILQCVPVIYKMLHIKILICKRYKIRMQKYLYLFTLNCFFREVLKTAGKKIFK